MSNILLRVSLIKKCDMRLFKSGASSPNSLFKNDFTQER